ncbi:hypothetical protein GGI43DRAFT_398779 [Trichoderma evansii]
MVLSTDPDTSNLESCERATDQTESSWPLSVRRSRHLSSSMLEVARCQGNNSCTMDSSAVCSNGVHRSQSRIVLSSDPDASNLESCEKATDRTGPVWPSRNCCSCPVSGSQSWMLPLPGT